jgi:DNA-binding response OmpR family regulator
MIPRKILIIDDEADLTFLISNFLPREDKVCTAQKGDQLSGSPHLDLTRETSKIGAVDYICKPFDFAHLNDTLNYHLNGALRA